MVGSNKSSSCLVHCNIGTFTPWGVILHMSLDCAFGCIERKDYTNNSHIDTKHDDLEHVYPFKYMANFGMWNSQGVRSARKPSNKQLKGTWRYSIPKENSHKHFPHTHTHLFYWHVPETLKKKTSKTNNRISSYKHFTQKTPCGLLVLTLHHVFFHLDEACMWSSIAWHSPEGSWLEALESTLASAHPKSWQLPQLLQLF